MEIDYTMAHLQYALDAARAKIKEGTGKLTQLEIDEGFEWARLTYLRQLDNSIRAPRMPRFLEMI